ncbi:beta-ribofuranosylaminobenzene 5'-phosphate synthase family protein [Sulfuriferula plumbiphila]|nr:beta-ribofuranosylaminobenzene 5'-phosphate synthase family protein [Sulfuriferula plumbiphila]
MSPTAYLSATVRAPARLHMGFLDLNGSLGRRFGSLGLAIEELATTVTAHPDDRISAQGPQAERAQAFARQALVSMGIKGGARLQVQQAIPEHAGLGSGTQLALAVGTALSRLYGVEWPLRDMATAMNRGGRSGIGLGLFEHGGFVVDGGRGGQDAPPTVISRLEFPAHWRLVLVFDRTYTGLHGEQEKQAFAALPNFPEASAGRLCRLALMQAMPALAEWDIAGFGVAVSTIQEVVGDHFAPAQGGRFASPRVARALKWFGRNGAAGVGQSSWGPTGFVLAESEMSAHALARSARTEFAADNLEFMVCAGRNRGAEIRTEAHQALAQAK